MVYSWTSLVTAGSKYMIVYDPQALTSKDPLYFLTEFISLFQKLSNSGSLPGKAECLILLINSSLNFPTYLFNSLFEFKKVYFSMMSFIGIGARNVF